MRNPCDTADPPPGHSPEITAWTADELRQFTAATGSHRWAGVWALLATTGMRRGELLGLRWSTWTCPQGPSPSGPRGSGSARRSPPRRRRRHAGKRTISIGPATVAALKTWKRTQAADQLLMGAGWQNTPARRDPGRWVSAEPGGVQQPVPGPDGAGRAAADPSPRRPPQLRHRVARRRRAGEGGVAAPRSCRHHGDPGDLHAHVLPGDDQDAALRADELLGESPATNL